MKNVHDFKIRDVEFSGYLLDFRKSMFVPTYLNVDIGDFVRMFEYDEETEIVTGRNLMFKIQYIDKSPGLIGIGNLWLIDLEKVKTGFKILLNGIN
jgi:hypothetical protein